MYSAIIPSIKYLGITKDKSCYCKLDTLANCKTINAQFYICGISNVYPLCA